MVKFSHNFDNIQYWLSQILDQKEESRHYHILNCALSQGLYADLEEFSEPYAKSHTQALLTQHTIYKATLLEGKTLLTDSIHLLIGALSLQIPLDKIFELLISESARLKTASLQ